MSTTTEADIFKKGVLYLTYSVSLADGVNDETEKAAMHEICRSEGIPNRIYKEFNKDVSESSEKEIYRTGIDSLKQCDKDHQLRTFAWIWKIMEADGEVHIKEARFLMYALKNFDVDIDEIISYTAKLPKITAA